MKLIADVKLQPTKDQSALLEQTILQANAACNYIAARAFDARVLGQYAIHKLLYHETRAAFPDLTAQIVVRCIARVAAAYKLNRKRACSFHPRSAIAYDDRILRWYIDKGMVSIRAIGGRQRIPFVCGDRQRALLQSRQGESDLVYRDGSFYLYATCNVEEPPEGDITGVLGVDLGIVNIAADSDGTVYSGAQVNALRHRHRRLRQKLQRNGSKPAKRLLKKRRRKESRFASHVNHCISKAIVRKAQDTQRAIAIEDLTGIRLRTTVRKAQRAAHASWSFYDLRTKIEYKARLAGVPVSVVDPRNTSRTCPSCGHIAKANRCTQSLFSCVACGFAGLADHIAAENIRRGAVNRPDFSARTISQGKAPGF